MDSKATYADIIIPLPLEQLFTYRITYEDVPHCKPGVRVIVPFGFKKIYTGVIKTIHNNKPEYNTKEIISVLDDNPIISDIQFKLWDWISEYYMCSIGDVFKAALPSGLKLESETVISLHEKVEIKGINEKEELLIGLISRDGEMTVNALNKETDFNVLPVIKRLIDKEIINAEERLKKKYKPKLQDFIRINSLYENEDILYKAIGELKRAKKQQELVYAFIETQGIGKEVEKTAFLKKTGFSSTVLNALVKKEIFIISKKIVSRISYQKSKIEDRKLLNDAQETAYNKINEGFTGKNVILLHGVTSSGKTEIYIKLIEEQLKLGKQVLYLLPEIALTTQITERLKNVFGKKLGVYHSKFSDNERVEVWKNLHTNDNSDRYDVILGVRSSVFLPFSKLGLIIVDEEHENTYKQYDPAPRYNARDVSVILAQFHKAKVLLGTATPSIESYYNAKSGKYGLVELFTRYRDIKLPQIMIDDTKEARRKLKMKSLFAPLMLNSIAEALKNKEQIILFQNRRGFSPYIECEKCGHIPKCENCDVSLTYHKYTKALTCHYCGYTESASKICNSCGNDTLRTKGFGTQKIEDEIQKFFPGAKTARMDLDTTSNKRSYQNIIYEFESGSTDILIGTQMVSKGLDFENVSLVGIMNADNMLNFPDFRAFERSFQLMAQVSGRAGRKKKQGKVIIQTSDARHPIILNVVENNYKAMFLSQSALRKQFKYPPFFRLIRISIKHKMKDVVDQASEHLAKELRKVFKGRVLGPEYAGVSRVKSLYIKQVLIKFEKEIPNKKAKHFLNETFEKVNSIKFYKYVQFVADVDPM